MSGIDERIVEMSFKGDSFLSGVKNTISALLSLKNGLNGLKGSENELNNLDEAGKRFSLKGISDQLDQIKSKFSLMHVAAITAFTNIVNRGVDAGISLVKALTVDPIKAGLDVYETKINAIQTILANTSSEGTNLKQVTDALNQLNTYANKTVYNFGQMAQNIGTFTAAGVGLKTSVESIKGIANLAALSGSTAEQASTAMYQLSQAIAAGSVKLQDWNSVVNAGLGGKVFQNALEETARASGVSIDKIIAKAGSFRNSLQTGWLTSGILTKTLATFTGDLSLAQLKAMGFTNQEAQAIFKQGQIAVQSATQIRTITQLTSALKEEVATAWASVFQAIIGNSVQAAGTLSALHNVAENFLTAPIYALAKILQAFSDLGGRTIVIAAVEQAFHDLGAVLGVVKQAFDAVFGSGSGGAGTASKLVVMAGAVLKLTEALKPSKQTLAELKTIFEGVFSAVKIVIDVFSGLIGSVGKVGGAATGAGGGFLSLIAKIAQFVINVKNAIESGGALAKFFQVLGTIISLPVKAIGAVIDALGGFSGAIGKAVSGTSSFVSKIGDEFSKLSDAIINGIKSGDLSKIGTIINQLLLGGVLVQIRKFIQGLGKGGEGGGLFDTIKESFEGLTNALKAMQQSLKAETLERIAVAVALLTVSLVALSFVNIGNLTKALAAMTVMFTELLGALAVIAKIAGSAGIVKMTVIGIALNELAAAILLLTVSVAILSRFSWSELIKGLSAIGILLTELAIATQIMASNTKGLIATAIAMEAMAVAINLMALAVKILGSLDFSTLAKGIGSVAALLLVIVGFQKLAGGEQLISSAAGMILIGAALNIMALAIAKIGGIPFGSLAKGIAGVAAVLLILVVAMNAMNAGIAGAAAMVVGAAALLILANVLNSLGSQSWSEIGKALVLLAGSLVIIAAAMLLMTGAIPGAAALLVVAASLAVLTPILIALGGLSWGTIVKGLVALAGVFAVIGVAGLLLGPLVPVLLGIGAAIALLGVGMLAAGVGIGLFAVGLTALAVAISASGVAILTFVKSILSLIPTTFAAIGQGIVQFAKAIGNGASSIVTAFAQIIVAVADGLVKAMPAVGKAIQAMLTTFLSIIVTNAPKLIAAFGTIVLGFLNYVATHIGKFVAAGVTIVVNLLNGIATNIPKVATAAGNVVIAFINAIGTQTQRIVIAGVNMVINLMNGIANELRAKTPALQSAARNLGSAIMDALIAAITGGLSGVVSSIEHVAESAINAAKSILHINSPSKDFMEIGDGVMEGWAMGHIRSAHLVTDSLTTVATAAISSLKSTLSGVNSLVSDGVDLQPTITPVIDLTQLKAGLSTMSSLTGAQTLKANVSASSAASISATNAQAAAQAGLLTGGSQITFEQNNYSPTALSAVDIYRRTKNQLSIARGALTGAN